MSIYVVLGMLKSSQSKVMKIPFCRLKDTATLNNFHSQFRNKRDIKQSENRGICTTVDPG